MRPQDLKSFILRYQQKAFALALYLNRGDRDKAYEITSSAFAEAIRVVSLPDREEIFLAALASGIYKKSRAPKTVPASDDSDFADISSEMRKSLLIVKTALYKLPLDAIALLLLRDQLHLSFKHTASILQISENDARNKTNDARIQIRDEIENILNYER